MGKRLLALALLLPALAACGSSSDESAPTTTVAPPPTTTAPAPRVVTITVFHVRNGLLRPSPLRVVGTKALAAAALGDLGLPPSVTIANGRADLDAPDLTEQQSAEVVYTLTQFPTVQAVSVNGNEPLTRADFQSYAPPILVDAPTPAASVGRTFRVTGTASVYEATLVVQVVRDGDVLEKQNVTASEGAPGRGTFETTLHATPGPATVQAFSPSAVDGSPQHQVDVAVTVKP